MEIILGNIVQANRYVDSVTVLKNSAKRTDDKDESVGISGDNGIRKGVKNIFVTRYRTIYWFTTGSF